MSTPSIQTLITQAQQVLNLKSSNEIRATLAAVLANANVGTPLNPNLTTQQLWDEFYEIVRQPSDDIMSIITDQMMRMVFSPPAPGGAGADKQVIFNDGGVLAGDTKFLWDKTANRLDVDGPVVITGDLTVATNVLKVTGNRVIIGATTVPDLFLKSYITDASAGTVGIGTGFSASVGYLGTWTNHPYVLTVNGSEAVRVNTTGNLVLKGGTAGANGVGVTFPATPVASSDANCLDDYEEGTFTPGITFGGASVGLTGIVFAGRYTKVGRTVTICGLIVLTNKGSSTGDALITGLPFANSNTPGGYVSVSLRLSAITFTNVFQGYIGPNQTYINLDQITVLGVQSALSNSNFSNSSELIWNATYDV